MPLKFIRKAYFKIKLALNRAAIVASINSILAFTEDALEATEPAAKTGYFSDGEADGMLNEIDRRLRNLKLRMGQLKVSIDGGRPESGYALMQIADGELEECDRIYSGLRKITDESDPLILRLGRMFAGN
ncbi:MAG: hypothetical protein K5770_03990 [Lachnospiraceae bacterium]|nr:hypothetical protein [Lachnospiraceae bacterium]